MKKIWLLTLLLGFVISCYSINHNINLPSLLLTEDTVPHFPIFVFDSVQHVRCPDGHMEPYPNDGAFSVHLTDSAQYYQQIKVHSTSYLFYDQIFHSDFRLTNLAAATYVVTAYGIDGSTFSDSITIVKPDSWDTDWSVQRIDTVCPGDTGCIQIGIIGGTPPYYYTWFYDMETEEGMTTVSFEDTTGYVCGLEGGGHIYNFYMHDSRGCQVYGYGIDHVLVYLWEYATDVEIIGDTVLQICQGEEISFTAISSTPGVYSWCYGVDCDSSNTYNYADPYGYYVSGFFSPPITESGWITVSFDNMTPCPQTRDSVYVDVVASSVWIEMDTVLKKDTTYMIYFHPEGGQVYLDEELIVSNSDGSMMLNTENLTASEHLLTYVAETDMHCDGEVQNVLFRVVSVADIPERNIHVSVYPNPVADYLRVSQASNKELILTLTDMTGKKVRQFIVSENLKTLSMVGLHSGVYLLHVADKTGVATTVKLVKQ